MAHLHAAHRAMWADEIEPWVTAEAQRLRAAFAARAQEGLLPEGVSRDCMVDPLDTDAIAAWLRLSITREEAVSLHDVRQDGEGRVQRLESYLAEVDFVAEIADLGAQSGCRDILLREGGSAMRSRTRRTGFLRGPGSAMRETVETGLQDLERASQRFGYGENFPARALVSSPVWDNRRIVDFIFAGAVVELRRAINEIRTRRQPPQWVVTKVPAPGTGDAPPAACGAQRGAGSVEG